MSFYKVLKLLNDRVISYNISPSNRRKNALCYKIINNICNKQIFFLYLTNLIIPINKRKVKRVLLNNSFNNKLTNQVLTYFAKLSSARKNILLIRSLLLNRILLLCPKKR